MTKEQAQRDTIKRFTNLIDGKVVPFASVATILNYYELLLADVRVDVLFNDGITQNFHEECLKELENEADCYDGI